MQNSEIYVSIITSSFLVYIFADDTVAGYFKHKQFFHIIGVFHAVYNVKSSDKYENVLKEMCCNHAYLIPGQEDQYVVN